MASKWVKWGKQLDLTLYESVSVSYLRAWATEGSQCTMAAGMPSGVEHSSPTQFISWIGFPGRAWTRTPVALDLAMFFTWGRKQTMSMCSFMSSSSTWKVCLWVFTQPLKIYGIHYGQLYNNCSVNPGKWQLNVSPHLSTYPSLCLITDLGEKGAQATAPAAEGTGSHPSPASINWCFIWLQEPISQSYRTSSLLTITGIFHPVCN